MELRGNLKDFSLPDIVQLVGFGRKTGVLQLHCGETSGSLYFEEGKVVHAERGEECGEPAVFALFHLSEGDFRFRADVPPPQRTIAMDSTNLVMEAARLLDESRRDQDTEWATHTVGSEDDWFAFEEEARDPQEIKQDIRELLRRRFGRNAKRLIRAVERCGDSVEELLDLADRLERYVQIFLDDQASIAVGQEIRDLISGSSSSSV
ncbi:MAG: hypothetical protein Kow0092_35300 [Deferrisomatales bacterium]